MDENPIQCNTIKSDRGKPCDAYKARNADVQTIETTQKVWTSLALKTGQTQLL